MSRNPNDITAYRKKRKRRNNIYKFLAIVLTVFGIFFIWTNGEKIFEPLRGIASRTGTTESGEGFPIMLSGSAGYSMNRFGSNFLLLSDTYLYTYNSGGGQIFAYRHNYARPFQSATDRRILLYNLNANEFSLFNRNGRIYEVKLDDRIVLAELGNNDMAAVVTTSTAFSNILYVYDGNGKWRYTKRFIDEEVNAVAFTSRNNEIIVATSAVRNGEIISKIYRLRVDTTDDVIWERTLPSDVWALNVRENGNYVTVLADNMMLSLYSADGEVAGSYAFTSGSLVRPVFGVGFNMVVLSDYVTGRTLFVTLDEKSNIISSEIMPFEAKQVEISGDMVYTLTGDTLNVYDKFIVQTGVIALEDEYKDFITADKYALLLGYETIERVALN